MEELRVERSERDADVRDVSFSMRQAEGDTAKREGEGFENRGSTWKESERLRT